jgi:endonuclease/exonuclease/phosphatase family metal-dependent hydrolase
MRVATMNILGGAEDWPQREARVRAGLQDANADLVALQETIVDAGHDQTLSLLDQGYHRAHQNRRGPQGVGMSLAARWPIVASEEVDLLVSSRVDPQDWLGTLLAVVVQAPEPVGPLIYASPKPSYQRRFEYEREQQAVRAARTLEAMAARYGAHVVLASDFDAAPESASARHAIPRRAQRRLLRCLGGHTARRAGTHLRSGQSSGRRTLAPRAGTTIGLHPHPL